MNKIPLRYFVSYATRNEPLVTDFLTRFREQSFLSPTFRFLPWVGNEIVVGQQWHTEIQQAIAQSDFGLLLLSPAFFNSNYITVEELPHFFDKGIIHKPIVPVGLDYFPVQADLLGLEAVQIFRYIHIPGDTPKYYSQLNGRRAGFVARLLEQITRKFQNPVAP